MIDFQKSNLHVVNYSIPVRRRVRFAELREHLHTLPDRPDWIPYRTSYYKEDWGFCLTHSQLERLEDGEYEVCIDSRLEDGSLTYGEYFIPGNRTDEVLLSCHACHPSLCNDNLSGVALVTQLGETLSSLSLNYSYRVLFIPGTIGSITWLAMNADKVPQVRHGLVVACVGDPGKFHYKKSRCGNAEIDRAAVHALRHCGVEFEVLDFSPYGYDERQYCSPGFNLSVGSLTRTPHGRYPQYHTSADDLDFVRPEALAGSLAVYLSVLRILEEPVHVPAAIAGADEFAARVRIAGSRSHSLAGKAWEATSARFFPQRRKATAWPSRPGLAPQSRADAQVVAELAKR